MDRPRPIKITYVGPIKF